MSQKLTFYKEDGRWYVDLPDWIAVGGSKEALEMIEGADEFLNVLCDIWKRKDRITLLVTDKKPLIWWRYEKLYRSSTVLESGRFYFTKYMVQMWLCDVVQFIFGDFPEAIYFKVTNE